YYVWIGLRWVNIDCVEGNWSDYSSVSYENLVR
uniref:Snaclec (Fragments) n=1 Tax=Bothrops diporus TaxID=1107943 RepID=SL1_BOTDP|nr:RecName: Full=Snaclec [Bothrops diporus]